jgi:UDP-GlcNAc:undecaprenyl-phosphate GlcNAc-1-phosphate transferase
MLYLYSFLIIFNLFFLFFFKSISLFFNIFDYPDKKRKFHKKKIANLGGVLIFINLLIFLLYFLFNEKYLVNPLILFGFKKFYILFIFCLLFFIIGILDDKFNLSANYKFLIFIILIYSLLHLDNSLLIKNVNFSFMQKPINIEPVSFFFTITSFLLFINAFNMFDGINLESFFYTLFLLLVFIFKNVYLELCVVLIISLIFFSFLNYKNKCFLGNNGSLLVAFIISYLSVKSVNVFSVFKADEIFLLMFIPGIDLLRLAFSRILNHRHPFSPDRNHIHHILMKKFTLSQTLIILILLIILPNIVSLLFGFTIYLILISLITYTVIIFRFR